MLFIGQRTTRRRTVIRVDSSTYTVLQTHYRLSRTCSVKNHRTKYRKYEKKQRALAPSVVPSCNGAEISTQLDQASRGYPTSKQKHGRGHLSSVFRSDRRPFEIFNIKDMLQFGSMNLRIIKFSFIFIATPWHYYFIKSVNKPFSPQYLPDEKIHIHNYVYITIVLIEDLLCLFCFVLIVLLS